jgi:hypothetical protein
MLFIFFPLSKFKTKFIFNYHNEIQIEKKNHFVAEMIFKHKFYLI